ncbi:MAG: hypothetical protein P4L82_12190 [Ancalomicrobiaceae bacterium]|nr:hypothetical protein [Ancalomicrobiaceae bacterium]
MSVPYQPNQGLAVVVVPDGSAAQQVVAPAQLSLTATIVGNDATGLSGALDLGALRALRIIMPAAWTAAALTFQTSADGTVYSNLYDETGNEVSYTPVAAAAMRLPISDWLGVRFLKIRSGPNAAPVAQAYNRVLTVVAG